MRPSLLSELKSLPPLDLSKTPQASLEVSLIIPAKNANHSLEATVQEAHTYLEKRFKDSFEIILVPNPTPGDTKDLSTEISYELSRKYHSVQVVPHLSPRGKGAAIRTGFASSRGKWIFFTDSDLPYELDFFDEALRKLKSGYDLVTGNRRLPESHFNVPVHLLRLTYGRHRLGLWFNRVVRWLLPIQTTDTQAGIKAMSRKLALESFSRQSCPGFLFDLEIFMTAARQGMGQVDLPVTLHLNSEKSTVRILRECILVANWLTRITWKNFHGAYGRLKRKKKKILRRYRSANWSTRFFLSARWRLTPYSKMASYLPKEGPILDLGCGHGLFSLAIALNAPGRQVLGIDHDQDRITLGSQAIQDLSNLRLEAGNLMDPPRAKNPYSGIAMIDVMHYFPPEVQERLFQNAYQLLGPGGKLLVREVNPDGGITSSWNRLYEKIATGIGFTQAEKEGLHFRTRQGWEKALEKTGFQVTSEPCSSFIFADILYICEKP